LNLSVESVEFEADICFTEPDDATWRLSAVLIHQDYRDHQLSPSEKCPVILLQVCLLVGSISSY
jgi:hypothetical protein